MVRRGKHCSDQAGKRSSCVLRGYVARTRDRLYARLCKEATRVKAYRPI